MTWAGIAFLEIARRMAISVEDVQKAADNIARLNPRPGQVFAAAPQNYVLPDVIVEKVDGEYQIAFNNEQIPHLRISNLYKDIIASGDAQSSDVKDLHPGQNPQRQIPDPLDPSTAANNYEHRAADRFTAARFPRARPIAFEADDDGRSRRSRRACMRPRLAAQCPANTWPRPRAFSR
jgi:hypothetical protein